VTGHGPTGEVIDLARWARWRWAGRTVHFLRTASPLTAVAGLPPPISATSAPHRCLTAQKDGAQKDGAQKDETAAGEPGMAATLAREGLARSRAVLRLPPGADVIPAIRAAAQQGPTLVVAASQAAAGEVARRLRQEGVDIALVPRGWAQAAAGARVVVGARSAAWAPVISLAAVVVLDEHDESHQGESSPTWSAREVAAERARRAGAACLWLSPCPSLEALAWAPLLTPSRAEERNGWPVVDVVDRRREEPLRAGLYSPRLVDLLRRAAADHERGGGVRAVCVLNRKGRSALLACAGCAELARCERCQAAVGAGEEATLVCRHCAAIRPSLCLACGSTRLKLLRPGVRRVRDDLERLVGVPVAEVTGDADAAPDLSAVPILVGTEAVLHRGLRPDVVAFLDLDAELLAPRYRAGEEALALVARAARMLGPRAAGGRLVLQTRLPGHEVVQAALHADPGRVAAAEGTRRAALHFPPATAMALVSGPPAADYVAGLGATTGVEVLGPADGHWLVRAADHRVLCDALAAVPRPPGRLRIAVDPQRM
jgi:primosomal protein N' (replication factor Y)